MNRCKLGLFALLGLTLVAAGCAKKPADQANVQGSGFETATTEDLAQLPQANNNANSNQQAGIEVLPIETSPVTQGIPAPGPARVPTVTDTLTHDQQIQTALKNAGFYTGKIDGKIGPGSKRAIEAFQESKGLKADGKVGPKTWSALEAHLNGGVSSSASATAASAVTSAATTD
ncbi:MAG: hypothetical protein COT00_05185 [Candidatus Omnitrophica bacterium CG07_land_8_20_14_0_80_50_8]|nr:MAG: hypothetical protein AUJ71_01760 [Candidatus Omnitrophica bacterium CG1_02_49_16]PIU39779.1 MAG: hypothetical protein COT00_05185 [Candidatus Omnitrophica bacterium CG07_land_8_20_14_0_80_50_8]